MKQKADVVVTNHGTIFTFLPQTDAAREWCNEHLPDDAQMFGDAYVVEHRYAGDIADGMAGDGLILE